MYTIKLDLKKKEDVRMWTGLSWTISVQWWALVNTVKEP